MKTGVSVIICCHNSASRLDQTLRHLSLQETPEYLQWEIVLVDNASMDNTADVARRLWRYFARSDIPLNIFDQPIPGLSFARARGIEMSQYNTIIFCDDDNWLQPNYLTDAHLIISSDPQIGALGGRGIAVADCSLPDWFETYKFCFACYPQGKSDGELRGPTDSLYGAGLAIRRDVLTKLYSRDFSPVLTDRTGTKLMSGGDTELCYAIRLAGYKLWYSEKLAFYHYIPPSRLSKSYLYKLNESLSYCRSSLMVYHYALMGKEATRYAWLKDLAYQLFYLCRSVIRYFIFTSSSFERRLDLAFSFNSLKGIFSQFGKYRPRYEKIMKLKTSS